jgi:hypothetical protein
VRHPRLIAAGTSLLHSSTSIVVNVPAVDVSCSDASPTMADRPCADPCHHTYHTAVVLIWLPPPRSSRRPNHTVAAPIRLPLHRSGRSRIDQPSLDLQSATSTTMRRGCSSACGISACGLVLGSLREAFNILLLFFALPDH